MAYKTADLEKQAIAAIDKYKLFFIEDVISFLPCSKQTFYDHKLDELDILRELLQKNKVEVKVGLRSKWYKSDNPTVQLALYRLTCEEDERRKLAMNYQELTGKDGKDLAGSAIIFQDISGKVIEND